MAQQTLNTLVVLSGRVDNKFGNLGNSLIALGSQIDQVSQKIIDFGKDSVKSFVGYEDTMLLVEQIGKYSGKTMDALDEYNKTIANTSKYTMEQAASAELLMARLGLSLEQTKELMPAVMDTATAAGIDLATSLDYLYYSTQALGKPMSYANTLADQMAKAADISAADIDTLGLSLQRLGSGAQYFAGGSSEILAILAGISQFGQDMQGTSAGTQLRNFMLTLLAPTASKQKLMAELGVTEDAWADFESYMEDAEINVTDTADAMNELGLKMYDSRGKMKPAIQIIGELDAALNSLTEAEQKEYLGKLFGKRTTITAENLLASLATIIEYQKLIENGSEGYVSELAESAESGLGGQIRELTAAYQGLKTVVGENISPEVGGAASILKETITAISSMDDVALSTLVGGFEGLAAAGPGLMITGGAIKLIGWAATPFGATALGVTAFAVALGALTKGISAYNEMEFESHFGDLDLDTEALEAHLKSVSDSFAESYEEVNTFSAALQDAVTNYTNASSALSGELLTSMITGAKMTPEEIENIQNLGTTMGNELLNGIKASMDTSASYLAMLYGGYEKGASDAEYADAILLAGELQTQLLSEAEQIGRDFGNTLGTAMDDGIITGDEYAVIMDKMRAYNEAMAFAAHADRQAEFEQQLHKAKGVSWDSASGFLENQEALMAQTISDAELTHVGEMAKWGVYYDEAIKRGLRTEDDKSDFMADMEEQYQAKVQAYRDANAKVAMATMEGLIAGSDYADAWSFLKTVLADMDSMEKDGLSGSLTLNDINWAALESSGLLTEDMGLKLFEMSKAVDKFEKIFGLYSDNPAIAKSLEQLQYVYALSQYADGYYARKAMLEGYDEPTVPTTEAGAGEKKTPISVTVDQQSLQEELENLPIDPAANTIEFPAVITGFEEGAKEAQGIVQEHMNANPVTIPAYVAPWMQTPEVQGPSTGPVAGLLKFAEGGRATEASIFGEAGAEWAIPEEHTQNTANLLWRAAQASGFTWRDIAAANAGTNQSRGGNTLVYSPTIVANDATGVETKLREDKANLERWLREKELKDKITVYA